MAIHPDAGKTAPQESLVNVPKLVSAYYLNEPDLEQNPEHCVAFGTSGHRGCSYDVKFNESHILAITQAICDYRKENDIFGPDGPSNGTITILTQPAVGEAVLNDGGTPNNPIDDYITYNPPLLNLQPVEFKYQICDADGDCDDAVVRVNILDDAPIDQAVEGIINGIYFNQGHVCCAGSRLFVQEDVADIVVRKLKDRMESLIVGDPMDKNTDIGAINSKEQLNTINKYIKIGKSEGASFYQSSCELPSGKGFWCRPTLFLNVSQSHRIAQEEIFGPVLAVQTFRTVEEVLEKANNTPYGLSAGVWSDKGAKIFNMTNKLRAGVIWANTYNKFDPSSPFGGYKESGFGREGGLHGLSAYLKI